MQMTVKKCEEETTMTYYFDNTAAVYEGRLIVVSSSRWMKIQREHQPGWLHHWIHGDYENMLRAQEDFRKEWEPRGGWKN